MDKNFPNIRVNIRYDDSAEARKMEKECASYFWVNRIVPSIGAAIRIGGVVRNCVRVEHCPTDNELFIEFN